MTDIATAEVDYDTGHGIQTIRLTSDSLDPRDVGQLAMSMVPPGAEIADTRCYHGPPRKDI